MGSSPAINIEIHTDLENAKRLAEEFAEWTEHEQVSKRDSPFEYVFAWADHVGSGDDEELQHLKVLWSESRNEYYGCDSGKKLLIHYSPYYSESCIERFTNKTIEMKNILEWLENNTNDEEINHYVASCTV